MNRENSLIFQLDGVPKFSEAFPLALQHVVAMIVGCVTPAIIISTAAKIAPADKVLMIQSALVVAGLSTLLQLFGLGAGKFRFGSRLPVIMGISFAYVPSMEAIAKVHGIGAILGAQIVGGVIALIVGLFIKQIQKFFPPLITGTVVFTIGLSLYPTAVNYMAGGKNAKDYGAPIHWIIALITLATVTILNHFAKGFLKLASILIGIIVGYIVSLCFGMVNFSAIADASWVAIPNPVHFGLQFDLPSCVAMGLLFAINSIQAIGDMTATTSGSMDRLPSEDELRGGILGYGFTNIIGALLGGLPTATFSQNVGIVTTTKVDFGICAKDFCNFDHHSSGSAWRSNDLCICFHCNDGYAFDQYRRDELSSNFDCWFVCCTGNGNFSGTGGTSNISGVGNDNFWKEPCCCDNRQCHYLEYYFAKGKEGEAIG